MVIAVWPCRNAARFSTKPNCSTPGGMNLFSLRIGEDLDADIAVDSGFHRIRIEVLAALVTEALLDHVHGVGRLAEESGAIHLRLIFVGQELPNSSNSFQVLGAS